MTFSGGQNILWPLLHIFRGHDPPTPQDRPPAKEEEAGAMAAPKYAHADGVHSFIVED